MSHVDYPAATWTRRPTSPEVVSVLANVAATGEIAIRRAATSAPGRALSAFVRNYPLWSVFLATTAGFMLRGSARSRPRPKPPGNDAFRPGKPGKPKR